MFSDKRGMLRRGRNIVYGLVLAAVAAGVAVAAIFSAGWDKRDWGRLELSLSDNPTTLDPALVKDVSGGRLAGLLYPNLVKYGSDDRLCGDLAEKWEIGADGRVYTFQLRSGARFADGTPITARDVVASFERTLAPEMVCPRAWVLTPIRGAQAFHEGRAGEIEGLKAEGDGLLRIELEKPSGTFLSLLTMPQAAVLPASTPRKPFWGVDKQPVAGGPYRIEGLQPDIALSLEANPLYYGARASMGKIRYRIIRNPFAVVTEFRQARLDIIEIPDAFDRFFMGDSQYSSYIESVEGLNIYYLGFNCTRAPFDSREFRRAICMVIDRRAIIDAVLHGKATAAAGPIPPGLGGYEPDFSGLPYDPVSARDVIAAARGGGRTLSLLVLANADTIIVAQALAGQLRAVGLSVEVAGREKGTFKALLRDGDFDMVYYSWVADYADAENFLAPLFGTSADRSGGNYTAYSNPAVDRLLERAASPGDEAQRARLYGSAARIIVEDAPRAFLWNARRVMLAQPWVKGYRPSRMYNAERFQGVTIEKGPQADTRESSSR